MQVYLDNAATTPVAKEVVEEMLPYLTEHYGNPSAQYLPGRTTRAAIEQSRKSIAAHLGAQANEIIFTSGGTESNNTALIGAVRDLGIKRIITTNIEHHCVFHTIDWLVQEYGIVSEQLSVDSKGNINLDELKVKLEADSNSTMVSIMHANNEIGVLNDIKAIGKICEDHKVLFHSDTVQTMAQYKIDTSDIHIHFLSGAAHKFHGPKGVGFMYVRNGFQVSSLLHGGGQERNKRPGTENVSGVVGMAKAMDMAYAKLEENTDKVLKLKTYFMEKLQIVSGDFHVNGPGTEKTSLHKVLSISFPPNEKGPLLLFNLDMEGVYVSGGSACSSGASKASHVLAAIGSNEDRPTIRFSFSRYNTIEELDFAIGKIKKIFGTTV